MKRADGSLVVGSCTALEERRRNGVLVERNGATVDGVEKFVLDHVLGGDAEGRVVDEGLLQQVHAGRADVLDGRGEVVLGPAREGCLVVRQRGDAGPDFLCRCAQDAEHAEQLIDLRVALEQRLARCHLSEDAADGPDVDGARVALGSQQDFWSAVPERDDLVRVVADRDAEGAAQAEVGDLDHAFLVDQQVLRLQIAVEDAAAVAEEHCGGDLVEIAAHQLRVHHFVRRQRVHVLLQVHTQELEDQVQTIVLHQHILEQNDVRMFQFLEQRDFTETDHRKLKSTQQVRSITYRMAVLGIPSSEGGKN